jgi:metal-responsive CopG/Arc/MetJ family transcriptional regulator
MRDSVTISLPKEIRKKLDQVSKQEKVNRSDLVREAVRMYLAKREFREIQQRLILEARSKGIFSEEDVFRIIS